ncbi:MAG TPA: amidohydrolase [Bacteroidales bacterium]|nr:amidohydrolase [Bacteroidales bacterium]HSA42718.1 amidohydrolase [Bacteroidales bacterium]
MKKQADLILLNGNIHTVDAQLSLASAMAVRDGMILATGTDQHILQHFSAEQVLDLQGDFVYPGFYDAHCHFFGYATTIKTMADLREAGSPAEMLQLLKSHDSLSSPAWLCGRGWDQNKWKEKQFPSKDMVDAAFPDKPVVLIRIDGHAVLANTAAIRALGLREDNIERPDQALYKNASFTGIFLEETADLFKAAIPVADREFLVKCLLDAEQECFSYGLTTVADAGLEQWKIKLIDSLQQDNVLRMQMYAMLEASEDNLLFMKNRKILKTQSLLVRAVKMYADGALGSRGACLLQAYEDQPGHFGIIVTPPEKLRDICKQAYDNGYQVCTHCIGDSAVRMVLGVYKAFLKPGNEKRWRIEHAQCVDEADFELFGKYNIIPSIQSTHATSDMHWAEQRLGSERIKNAYAYRKLLQQNGWLPNGTDFPIEQINPLLTFYAAFSRRDANGYPAEGFQIDQAFSRQQALQSITIWAAKACFEDDIKGSLEKGKRADFVIMEEDLLTEPLPHIPVLKVKATYLGGKCVFSLTR